MRWHSYAAIIGLCLRAIAPSTSAEEVDYSDFEVCKGLLLDEWEGIEARERSDLVVTGQFAGDSCAAEILFQIGIQDEKQNIQGRLALGFPEGAPQLTSLGELGRRFTPIEGCPKFLVATLSEQRALRQLLYKLKALKLELVREPLLCLHGDTYELTVVGPYSTVQAKRLLSCDPKEPIRGWYRELFRASGIDVLCSENDFK